jgi:tetratricopeptide (TPR) repeat protein
VASSSDAVALLAERAQAQDIHLDLDADTLRAAVSVCRQLDGMPLAIELAAARLRSMSLHELAGRLDQRFRLLTGGSRTALERHQTLRAAIGWSYSLLNQAEQLLFGRLSVFAGGFDLPAAEQVCGYADLDRLEVAGLVGSLVDKSLAVAEPTGSARADLRYRLLETIRLVAADRLAEIGGDSGLDLARAHAAHYLALAETAAPHLTGPQLGTWRTRLDTEQANLQRATEYTAADPHATEQVLRFAIALHESNFARRYGLEEWAEAVLSVLQRPEAAATPALFAEALWVTSHLANASDVSTSLRLAEQMDQVASELGDNRLLAMSRERLSFLYWSRGDLERAWPLGQESVQRARKLGDDVQLARSLQIWILSCHPVLGFDPQTAGPMYAEAIACTERSGDLGTNSGLHNNAACYRLYLGDIPAARAHLEAAVRAAEMIGGAQSPAVLDSLGEVLRAERDFDGARSAYQDALRLSRRTGVKTVIADTLLHLAVLATDTGQWERAATLHGAGKALADQTGIVWDPDEEGCRQESLGQIAAALGDEQLKQTYTRGAALRLDHAIDLALGKPTPS